MINRPVPALRCFAVFALGTLASAHLLSAGQMTFTAFDPPGSANTHPTAMNASGTIVGYYQDANSVEHGFVRTREGYIQTYDAPGTDTSSGAFVIDTLIKGINDSGEITGNYSTTNGVYGFLRTPNVFNASWFEGVFPGSINDSGAITGIYAPDLLAVSQQGFLRTPNGTFTAFVVPGSGTRPFQGVIPNCINRSGAIVGTYVDESNASHGFLRAADGTITTLDVPGGPNTLGNGINDSGTIIGAYWDASQAPQGFVRTVDGTVTTVEVAGQSSYLACINGSGTITGRYMDAQGASHGFVRTQDGAVTTFKAPGAGTNNGQGTFPAYINALGEIAGSYVDAKGAAHGFLLRL